MSKNTIINKLQDSKLKKRIQQAGITHLRLFGSGAINQLNEDSDIDLIYEFNSKNIQDDRGVRGLYDELQTELGYPIELIKRDTLSPTLHTSVFNSMISIF